MRYLLTIAYDGTPFGGWQIQPNAVTVQELIQKALSTILRTKTHITGAGRTDAGVHARDQKAHFEADEIDLQKTQLSLNGLLPPEIRILSIEPTTLHARYDATGKIYTYTLHTAPHLDPFTRHYTAHIRTPLDKKRLREAADHFIGTHDFTTFANAGGAHTEATRTIYSIDIQNNEIVFHGSGFLYKMVRNLVGAMLAYASGRELDIPALLAARDRRLAPPPAPAAGLTLTRVLY